MIELIKTDKKNFWGMVLYRGSDGKIYVDGSIKHQGETVYCTTVEGEPIHEVEFVIVEEFSKKEV